MEPTLFEGDRLRIAVDPAARPERGEIWLMVDPEAPRRKLVKRIAAVGGDAVWSTRAGFVPIPPMADRSVVEVPDDALEEIDVPPGQVLVISDRPQHARDGRRFGPVPLERLVGRAVYRYAPRSRAGPL